jgi:hypothetical protein
MTAFREQASVSAIFRAAGAYRSQATARHWLKKYRAHAWFRGWLLKGQEPPQTVSVATAAQVESCRRA